VDTSTGTIRVRGLLPNPDGLLYPGLFARVRVPFEQVEDAVLVVEDSLGIGLEGPYLLVVAEDGTVERRAIEVGQRQDDGTVVARSGISPDERYILRGLQRARPGQKVDPVMAEDPLETGMRPEPAGPDRPIERPPELDNRAGDDAPTARDGGGGSGG